MSQPCLGARGRNHSGFSSYPSSAGVSNETFIYNFFFLSLNPATLLDPNLSLPCPLHTCLFLTTPPYRRPRILLPMQETQETQVQPLGREDSLEEEMATGSRILAWKIPWTEEPGRLQSMGF